VCKLKRDFLDDEVWWLSLSTSTNCCNDSYCFSFATRATLEVLRAFPGYNIARVVFQLDPRTFQILPGQFIKSLSFTTCLRTPKYFATFCGSIHLCLIAAVASSCLSFSSGWCLCRPLHQRSVGTPFLKFAPCFSL